MKNNTSVCVKFTAPPSFLLLSGRVVFSEFLFDGAAKTLLKVTPELWFIPSPALRTGTGFSHLSRLTYL
jgi:hypothetical protein